LSFEGGIQWRGIASDLFFNSKNLMLRLNMACINVMYIKLSEKELNIRALLRKEPNSMFMGVNIEELKLGNKKSKKRPHNRVVQLKEDCIEVPKAKKMRTSIALTPVLKHLQPQMGSRTVQSIPPDNDSKQINVQPPNPGRVSVVCLFVCSFAVLSGCTATLVDNTSTSPVCRVYKKKLVPDKVRCSCEEVLSVGRPGGCPHHHHHHHHHAG